MTLALAPSTASGVGINPAAGGPVTIADEPLNMEANNVTVLCQDSDTFPDGSTSMVIARNGDTIILILTGQAGLSSSHRWEVTTGTTAMSVFVR